MTEKDFQIDRELKRKLDKKVSLVDVRVFGSRATGKEDEFSDLDVFIEVESLAKELKEEIYDIAWEVGFKHGVFISPLIFSREEIEHSPLKASPIVKNIMEDGINI